MSTVTSHLDVRVEAIVTVVSGPSFSKQYNTSYILSRGWALCDAIAKLSPRMNLCKPIKQVQTHSMIPQIAGSTF